MAERDLKKYQELRKEKITVFGGSVESDWFIMNLIALVFVLFVFVFLYLEIREIVVYEPVKDSNSYDLLNDDLVSRDLDEIIERFQSGETESNLDLE